MHLNDPLVPFGSEGSALTLPELLELLFWTGIFEILMYTHSLYSIYYAAFRIDIVVCTHIYRSSYTKQIKIKSILYLYTYIR